MSIHPGLRISAVVVAAAGVLAACAGGGSGNPPASTSVPSAATQTPAATGAANDAPKVPAPLPTDALVANPCSALSTAQMSDLGVAPPGSPSTNQGGPVCQWKGAANTSNYAFVNVLTADKNGLSDIYAVHSTGKYAYFEPLQVDGYPAVYAEPSDERANGSCTAFVGVTDQLVASVSVQLQTGSNKTHSCDSADQIAAAMIKHLKGAA